MHLTPRPLHPDQVHAGVIAEYRDVWDKDKIDNIINIVEQLHMDPNSNIKFNRATVLNSADVKQGNTRESSERTNSQIFITESAFNGNEDMRKLNNDFFDLVDSAVKSYVGIFNIMDRIYYNEGFNLLRYQGGEYFDAHYDGGTGTGRCISPILYLNDDYDGGEIDFINFGLKIKPKAGTLYLFPSNYAYSHIAHPVKSGTKYAIVTWLHDRMIQQPNANL
jgi:hypothetical protein